MSDCLFCKIAAGEIPASKIYEDDDVLAFLDIAPANKGHTLVIPKEHYATIFDIPGELLSKVASVIKKCAPAVMKGSNASGINIAQNNFEAAGQVIHHLHFHLVPRTQDDGLKLWPQGTYEDGEAEQYKGKILQALDNN